MATIDYTNSKMYSRLIKTENKTDTWNENHPPIKYARFNGSTSTAFLNQSITLSQTGDFIEFTARYYKHSIYGNLGLFGTTTNDKTNVLGFQNSGDIWLRDNSENWIQWSGYAFENFRKIRIEITSSGWTLFLDDIEQSSKAKIDDLIIDNVGDSYNYYEDPVECDLQNFRIKNASQDIIVDNIVYDNDNFSSKTDIFFKTENHAETYVEYDQSAEVFIIYTKQYGNVYLGFNITHEYDMSDSVYKDLWRIKGCKLYEFDGIKMNDTGTILMTPNESEMAYVRNDTGVFVGGYHGHEILSNVYFFIDGRRMSSADVNTSLFLKPAKKFEYVQISTIHEPDNLNHPVDCQHIKKTEIKEGRYKTYNKLTWQASLTISSAYLAISTISIESTEYAYNNQYNIVEFVEDDTQKLQNVSPWCDMWSESKGIGVEIVTDFKKNFDIAAMKIWDRADNYHKYYRDVCSAGNEDVVSGDVWEATFSVSFSKSKHKIR